MWGVYGICVCVYVCVCVIQDMRRLTNLQSLSITGNWRIKQFLEFLAFPFLFNTFIYRFVRRSVEQYAVVRRDNSNDVQFSGNITSLETKVALHQMRRYSQVQTHNNKMRNLYKNELGAHFLFPDMPLQSTPSYPYCAVIAKDGLQYDQLKQKNIPVRRFAFGGLEKDALFTGALFQNFREQQLRANYFVLPTWINEMATRHIITEIQKIYE